MAWSITSLANYNENASATASKTTGSLSIPADSVILVFGQGSRGSGAAWSSASIAVSDSVDSTTGWVGLDSQVNLGPATFEGGGRAFYKSFTGSTSRTITISRSTGTAYWGYSVIAVTGQDTSNPIVQAKGAGTEWDDSGGSHTQSVTLSSSPTSGNAVVWFLGVNNDGDGAATIPSGYTTLSNPSAQFEATNAAYHTSTTSAAINCTDCGEGIQYAVAFAVELLAAGGGGGGGGANTGVSAWFSA